MTDALSIAGKYIDAWNRHDGPGIIATFAEGGTYTDPLAPGLSGEAIAAYARGLWEAFPDLSFELVGSTLAGNGLVATQWFMKGTNTGPFRGLPPTGRPVALPGADFIQVDGEGIRSVNGYFDAGEVPRQLGLQVTVQPHQAGPFRFGNAVAVQSGKHTRPGAFSITTVEARSDEEVGQIRNLSRQIALEALKLPGFIGWTGMTIGHRMMTVTAWEDAESPRALKRGGTHLEATKKFFGTELAAGGFTSVWVAERFNATLVRCTGCGRMTDYDKVNGQCGCGATLPEPPPYW